MHSYRAVPDPRRCVEVCIAVVGPVDGHVGSGPAAIITQQLVIATLTVGALNLSIPSEALRHRGFMTEFLDRYNPLLNVTDSTSCPRRRPGAANKSTRSCIDRSTSLRAS